MKPIDLLTAIAETAPDDVSAQEQARLKKWREAAAKAYATGKMANTLAKALASRFAYRWQFVDFLGPKGRESAGIVDIVAIRKCGRRPTVPDLKRLDTFELQLIQVKGGTAPLPTQTEIRRLRLVQRKYDADRVVLFEWIKGKTAKFSVLQSDDRWMKVSPSSLFGSGSKNE